MIAEILRDNLIAIAEAYGKATGKTLAQVSKKFYGNTDFLSDLKRDETTITLKKLDELIKAFKESWPDNADWPFFARSS